MAILIVRIKVSMMKRSVIKRFRKDQKMTIYSVTRLFFSSLSTNNGTSPIKNIYNSTMHIHPISHRLSLDIPFVYSDWIFLRKNPYAPSMNDNILRTLLNFTINLRKLMNDSQFNHVVSFQTLLHFADIFHIIVLTRHS